MRIRKGLFDGKPPLRLISNLMQFLTMVVMITPQVRHRLSRSMQAHHMQTDLRIHTMMEKTVVKTENKGQVERECGCIGHTISFHCSGNSRSPFNQCVSIDMYAPIRIDFGASVPAFSKFRYQNIDRASSTSPPTSAPEMVCGFSRNSSPLPAESIPAPDHPERRMS